MLCPKSLKKLTLRPLGIPQMKPKETFKYLRKIIYEPLAT